MRLPIRRPEPLLLGMALLAAIGLWLFIAVPIRHEVATVEMSYPITWSLASALFILYYVKGGWMQRCAEKWEKKQAG